MTLCLNCKKDFQQSAKKETCCSIDCANTYFKSKAKESPVKDNDKFIFMTKKHEIDIAHIRDNFKVRTFTMDKARNTFFEDLKYNTKIICLANAGCRCEKCDTEENLTVHHVFTRRLKQFMPFNRYLTQRYYWKNIIVLCIKCHTEYHSSEKDWDEDLVALSPNLINKVKSEFFQ